MNSQAALLDRCLRSYREANQPGAVDRRSLGDEIAWTDSPSRLARILKARLLAPSTVACNFLPLAILILEARAHA